MGEIDDVPEMCPNGCGEMQTAYGHINDNEGNTYWRVWIPYCPKCMYYEEATAEL